MSDKLKKKRKALLEKVMVASVKPEPPPPEEKLSSSDKWFALIGVVSIILLIVGIFGAGRAVGIIKGRERGVRDYQIERGIKEYRVNPKSGKIELMDVEKTGGVMYWHSNIFNSRG